jgi:hypothetical protein
MCQGSYCITYCCVELCRRIWRKGAARATSSHPDILEFVHNAWGRENALAIVVFSVVTPF